MHLHGCRRGDRAHIDEEMAARHDLSDTIAAEHDLAHLGRVGQHGDDDPGSLRNLGGARGYDRGVTDLIDLVVAVDGLLQAQAGADADYFTAVCGRTLAADDTQALHKAVLDAYRWQYIMSGVSEPRFTGILGSMIDERQSARIGAALAPLGQA
jgi:hypothetical protein